MSDTANAPTRPADLFSVVKTGSTATDPRNRIDYRVAMRYNGQPLQVENKKPITLTGVNTALIRPVTLPGFRVPVICTPTPLDLTVLPFAKASKTAGRYSGTLRVNLAADALAP
nr:CfaE/CblD family pilus tip adhesin [Shimwellia pseudoproteus]